MTKKHLRGGKTAFVLHALLMNDHKEKPRLEPGDETEAETVTEHWLLIGSPSVLGLPSNTTQDHLPWDGTTHSRQGPPISIINQKKVPTALPADQSHVSNSSVEVPSSQVTLICVRLKETNQHRVLFKTLKLKIWFAYKQLGNKKWQLEFLGHGCLYSPGPLLYSGQLEVSW